MANSWFGPKFSSCTDEELMLHIAAKNTRAFDELYKRYSSSLVRYFYRMLFKDRERAEDFMQDLFMKIINKPEAFNTERKFTTWMYSVANNMCKNEYRRLNTKPTAELDVYEQELESEHGTAFVKQIDHKTFKTQLFTELEVLDNKHRSTFLLRYEEGLSLKEISAALDCSEGTVKSRLFYTLRKLSSRLKVFDPNPSGTEKNESISEI
jgi:RNA polymerase sigma-70 factor (ECF subfamily)